MNTLQCARCRKFASNPNDLLQHASEKHAIAQSNFPCHDCRLTGFTTEQALIRHRQNCWGPSWVNEWHKVHRQKSPLCNGKPQFSDKRRGSVRPSPTVSEGTTTSAKKGDKAKVLHSPISPTTAETPLPPARHSGSGLRTHQPVVDSWHTVVSEAAGHTISHTSAGGKKVKQKKLNSTVLSPLGSSSVTHKPARRHSRAALSPSYVPSTSPPPKSPPPKLLLHKSGSLSYTAEVSSNDSSNVGATTVVESKPRSSSNRNTLPKNSKKMRELLSLLPPVSFNVTSKRTSDVLSSSLAPKSSKRPGMKEARASTASQRPNDSLLPLCRRSSSDAGITAPPKPVRTRGSQRMLEPEGDGSNTRGAIDIVADVDTGARQSAVPHSEGQRVTGVTPRAGNDSSVEERLNLLERYSSLSTSDPSSGGRLVALRRRTTSKVTTAVSRRRLSGNPTPSTNEILMMSPILSDASNSRVTAPADLSADAVSRGVHESLRDLLMPSDAPDTVTGGTSHVDSTKSVELPPSQNLFHPSPPSDSLRDPTTSNQPVLDASLICSETDCLPASSYEHTSLSEREPAAPPATLPSEVVDGPTVVIKAPVFSSGVVKPPLEFKDSEKMLSLGDCFGPEKSSLEMQLSLNGLGASLACANLASNVYTENPDGHTGVTSPNGGLPKLLIDEDHAAVSYGSKVFEGTPSHSIQSFQLSTSSELCNLVSTLPSSLSPHCVASKTDSTTGSPEDLSGSNAVARADSAEPRFPNFQATASPIPVQSITGTVSPIFEASGSDEKSVFKDNNESHSRPLKTDCSQTCQIDPVGAQATLLGPEGPVATDTNQNKVTDTAAPVSLSVSSTPEPRSNSCVDKIMTPFAETERLSNGNQKAIDNSKINTRGIKTMKLEDAVERYVTPLKKLPSPAKTTSATCQPTNCSQSTKTKAAAGRETGSKGSATAASAGEVTLIDWDSFIALPVRKAHATGGGPRHGTSGKQTSKPATPKSESSSSEGRHGNQSEDANGRPPEPSDTAAVVATVKERRRPPSPSVDSSHSDASTPRPSARKRLKLAHVVESGKVSGRAEESLQSPSLAKESTTPSAKGWPSSRSSRVDSPTGDEGGSVSQADSSMATVPGDQTIPALTRDDDDSNETASSSPLSSNSEQNPSGSRLRPFLRSSSLFKGAALFGSSRLPAPETASTLLEAQARPVSVSSIIRVKKAKEEDVAEKQPDNSESSGLDTPTKPSVSSVIKNQSRFADRKSINLPASPPVNRNQESTEILRCQVCGLLTSRRCALQMHMKRRHPELYVPVGAVARAALKAAATTTTARSRPRSRGPQKRRPASLSQVVWRCPGCYPSTNSFPSALELLSHLPHCRRTAGSRAFGGHHGSGGLKWSPWPEPLSLPGTGFGCCICGLLFASASRLDRHRRASHDSKCKARISVAGVESDAFMV